MATDNGAAKDVRSSALWGTGNRGGEHRSSALWGRGGRGAAVACIAAFALLAPLAALAGSAKDTGSGGVGSGTYVQAGLLDQVDKNKNQKLHLIVQSAGGVGDAQAKITGLGASVRKQLNLIGAVAIDVTAGKLKSLAKQPGLIITPDSPVHTSGNTALYT